MHILGPQASLVLKHPGAFVLQTLRGFRANQGLLLAGGVAYYALLSIVPLLILIVIALSHFIGEAELLHTLGRYLEWLIPGQSKAIVSELENFLEHREVIGWVLLVTMIFFSSLAFTVLENAMSVIFFHRVAIRRRHFLVSALLPYCYILCLAIGLLLVTLVSEFAGAGPGKRRTFRTYLVPRGNFRRPALPSRLRRRNPPSHVRLHGHACRAAIATARADWWRHGGTVMGTHPPCAGLVLRHPVAGQRRLRITDDSDRGAVQPGARGDDAPAWRPGHLRIRTCRQRPRRRRTAETVSYRPDARLVPADQVQQRDRYVVLKRGAPEGQCVAIRELSGQAAPGAPQSKKSAFVLHANQTNADSTRGT